ncbi:hypothetical protein C173_03224 [Paenibacillus sp. FSL R7-277]|uniref:DUF6979 family protein n=1 Tax=Paenibacillus sp. FSL R7-277 TaxID=1227352 RepID=UPI0003E1C4BB|nr:hypothetical protein [Paenibacillus sp. FSL R7-277]ETT77494.1 hypothetical protein C173_03224 [Paenibacillus sp. FSL R7-277]
MNKYAQSAIRAVGLCNEFNISPIDAWNQATIEIFGANSSSQRKDCPRNAFLGLCEEGLVRGVPSGTYITRPNNKNKAYAVEAVKLLKVNPELASDRSVLWKELIKGDKKHNEQMHVVIALWESKLIMVE